MIQTPFPGMDVRLEGHSSDLTLRFCNIGQYNEGSLFDWLVSAVDVYLLFTSIPGISTLVME